ncbi:MAG: amino acid ABC transporter permease [Bacillota bacterium]|nr:amino acid ABC transporter permease [Bacillota bacterium]MDW7682727.1 amino acid ABC transporter permease [Bacillota bacterium]
MFNFDFPYDFTVIPQYFPNFWPAAVMTLQITTLGILFGLFLGLVVALLRISKIKILNAPARAYIWAIRGTPLLLQLWIVYYGLAPIVKIPGFPSAVIALGVHNAAYIAEIFRGAIQSIDRGQREAGLSLGMTTWQTMKRIILPQAFKRAVPPLGNQFIIALKDSSLASTIAVHELLLRSRQYASSTFLFLEMLIIAGIYYLIMTSVLSVAVGKVEERLRVSEYRG